MIIGMKDGAKLAGISIIACCAVLVCTMFLNFHMDITGIKDAITSEQMMMYYNAQVSTAKVTSIVSGGCLLATSVIMLIFYVKHYIDTHKKELGILKALGYSNMDIAKHFWIFGTSVFAGTLIGFGGAFLLMPGFYEMQNKDEILPKILMQFHPSLFVYLVIVPTAVFAVLAVFYAYYKLKMPVLGLLKEQLQASSKIKKHKEDKHRGRLFTADLKKTTLSSRKSLVFFIIFASFCFSAMTQMSFSMKELANFMMGAMIMMIGIVLACTTLFIAITTVINGNIKTIAMMRVFGYSQKECSNSILGGYRPISYLGFAIGTVYQYALLRTMVDIVYKDVEGVPKYEFDVPVMLASLAAFIIIYEIVMYLYSKKIQKVSVKEIMLE